MTRQRIIARRDTYYVMGGTDPGVSITVFRTTKIETPGFCGQCRPSAEARWAKLILH